MKFRSVVKAMSTPAEIEALLQPPRQEQVQQYLNWPAAYLDPFSAQPSLDVLMATIQALEARIKILETKTLTLKVL